MNTETTAGGIFIATTEPDESPKPKADQHPVLKGWVFTKCGDRYTRSEDLAFRKEALERLYIAADPGGGRLLSREAKEAKRKVIDLIDQLAVELVGGVPEGFEQYT
jgi:hypothetical protein